MPPCTAPPARMSPDEKQIVRKMHFEDNLAPAEITRRMVRDRSSITRLFAQKRRPNRIGRPATLTGMQVNKMI